MAKTIMEQMDDIVLATKDLQKMVEEFRVQPIVGSFLTMGDLFPNQPFKNDAEEDLEIEKVKEAEELDKQNH